MLTSPRSPPTKGGVRVVAVPQSTRVAHLYLAWTRFPSPQHACAQQPTASPCFTGVGVHRDMRARTLWSAIRRNLHPTRERECASLAQGLTVGLVFVSLLGEYLHTHSNPHPTAHLPSLGGTDAGALRSNGKKGKNPPPQILTTVKNAYPAKYLHGHIHAHTRSL